MHAKFFNFFFFSPNLMAALDNALILVSCRKKSRRQCNTKTRSASIDYLSVIKIFGARKQGLIRPRKTKALNNKVFFSLLFLSES